jgi:AbrB family looped-hinge helix DNA binding protein
MPSIGTTKMSSKGQVVIPEEIRKQLKLKAGSQFVVVGEKDTVILKTLAQPPMNELEYLLKYARKQARKVGLKRSDIKNAVSKVRKKK